MTRPATRYGLWACVLMCIAMLAASAFGQQPAASASAPAASSAKPGEPGELSKEEQDRRAKAKEHFLRGVELVQNERWDAALAEFLASRELHPTRAALKNAGACLRQLNRMSEALDMYNELVQRFGPTIPPDEKKVVDDAIEQLRKQTALLTVAVEPAGAVVIVDGKERGAAPLAKPIVLDAGTHSIRFFKEGYLSYETQVLIAGGQQKTVQATLKALAESGRLNVQERDGKVLDVVVDGAVVGKTPWSGVLAVGTHVVHLTGEGDVGTPPSAATVASGKAATLTLVATKLDSEIKVEPTPSNARVDVDGVMVGNGAWGGRLTSGQHRIEVTADGFLAYRKEIKVQSGQREVLKVSLERNLADPRWREKMFRPHIFLEAVVGAAVSPSFGGGADKACSSGPCSGKSIPLGFIAGARGGYQLTSGLGLELFVGYLQMQEKMTRKQTAKPDPTYSMLESTDYKDTTKMAGVMAALSASYQFFDKTPLLFRLSAGAARVSASFTNKGNYNGKTTVGGQDVTYTWQNLSVPEANLNLWVPFVGPELRFGFRINKRFSMDLGLAVMFMFAPDTQRQGASSLDQKTDGRRSTSQPNITNVNPAGTPINPGMTFLTADKGFSTFIAFFPTIGGRFDF